jgi:heme/copper-type cytochrome/quinol oxidase subunit 1
MEYTPLDLQANPYINPLNIDQYMTVMFTVFISTFLLLVILSLCEALIHTLKLAVLLTSPAKRGEVEKMFKEVCKMHGAVLIITTITFSIILSFEYFFPSNIGKGLLRTIHIEKTEVKK